MNTNRYETGSDEEITRKLEEFRRKMQIMQDFEAQNKIQSARIIPARVSDSLLIPTEDEKEEEILITQTEAEDSSPEDVSLFNENIAPEEAYEEVVPEEAYEEVVPEENYEEVAPEETYEEVFSEEIPLEEFSDKDIMPGEYRELFSTMENNIHDLRQKLHDQDELIRKIREERDRSVSELQEFRKEQLSARAELSEKVHKDNVLTYRNVKTLMKDSESKQSAVEENITRLKKMMKISMGIGGAGIVGVIILALKILGAW